MEALRGEIDKIRGKAAETFSPDLTQSMQMAEETPKTESLWHKLRGLAGSVSLPRTPLLVVAVLFGCYLTWVNLHLEQLKVAHQRDLAYAAEVFENAVSTAKTNVENLTSKDAYLDQFLKEQPYLELFDPKLKHELPKDQAGAELGKSGESLTITLGTTKFRFLHNRLLEELSFLEPFRSVALFDSEGNAVLSARVANELWTKHLRWSERSIRGPSFGDQPALSIVDLKQALDTGDGQPSFEKRIAGASRSTATVGGELVHVFLQPLRLQIKDGDKPVRLLLAGFAADQELTRQAQALETYVLALLLLAIALFCIGYPFLKLYKLHAAERFKILDLHFLYLSTCALLALLVTILLTVDGYIRYQHLAEDQQRQWHGQLEQDFRDEIRAVHRQAVAYDRCELDADRPPTERVQIDQIAWIDNHGDQLFKYTPTDEKAANLSVRNRPYYRAVVGGALWKLTVHPDDPPAFFVGPARSISDGQFYSFLSMPSSNSCVFDLSDEYSAVVTTFAMHSLAERPLPAGLGFTLVNREGLVLYHSDPRRALRENLIETAGGSPRLRALLLAGAAEEFDNAYQGSPHHFRVTSIGHMATVKTSSHPGLFLVTFHDQSLGRYIAVRTFTISLVWPQTALAVWMIAAMALAGLLSRVMAEGRRRAWRWIYICSERAGDYRDATLTIGVGVVIALAAAAAGWNHLLIALPLAAPLTAIWFVILKPPKGSGEYPERWHMLLVILLALSMSLLPSIGVFRVNWGRELGRFLAYSEAQAAQRSADLPEETGAKLRRETVEEPWLRQAVASRAKHMTMIPRIDDRGAALESGPEIAQTLEDAMSWRLPVRNKISILSRGHQPREFAPISGLPLLAGLIPVLGLLWWWIRWNSRSLLLAESFVAPGINPLELNTAWEKLPDPAMRWLLVQVAEERIGHPRHLPAIEELARRGWLRLTPEIGAATTEIGEFLKQQSVPNPEVAEGEGWLGMRSTLWGGVAFAVVFLFATQEDLPVDISVLLSFGTGTMGGAVKLLEQLSKWAADEG